MLFFLFFLFFFVVVLFSSLLFGNMAPKGSVEDFIKCQKKLATSDNVDTILGVLAHLHKIPNSDLDRQSVKKSKVGKAVGALRKHQNNEVKEQARSLVKKWRDVLEAPPPSSSVSSRPSPSSSHPSPSSSRPSSSASSSSASSSTTSRNSTDASKYFKGQEGERVKIGLYNSVAVHEFTEEEKEMHFLVPEEVAYCVDEALVEAYPQGRQDKKYAQKARDLIFNLKKNKELVSDLMSRDIHPQRLVQMNNEELANKEMKNKIRSAKQYVKELSTTITKDDIIDLPPDFEGVYTCRRCKSKRTKYDQLQTRGGDEPMTNFVTCFDCKYKFRD